MPPDKTRQISRHFSLGDLLVDSSFPELADQLDPDADIVDNLGRLTALLDQICDRFPPGFEVLSGYRDQPLNDACREAGLPASVNSLHLHGCAADVRPRGEDIDPETVFEWLRERSPELSLHEAVYYPKKGFIHVAVLNHDAPTPKRILMRI